MKKCHCEGRLVILSGLFTQFLLSKEELSPKVWMATPRADASSLLLTQDLKKLPKVGASSLMSRTQKNQLKTVLMTPYGQLQMENSGPMKPASWRKPNLQSA